MWGSGIMGKVVADGRAGRSLGCSRAGKLGRIGVPLFTQATHGDVEGTTPGMEEVEPCRELRPRVMQGAVTG